MVAGFISEVGDKTVTEELKFPPDGKVILMSLMFAIFPSASTSIFGIFTVSPNAGERFVLFPYDPSSNVLPPEYSDDPT